MPINANATIQDDLTVLDSVSFLRTIQGLLLNHSSEEVRDRMDDQGVDVGSDAAIPRNDANFTKQDLMESPFFTVNNIRPLPLPRPQQANNANATARLLSGNVSTTARAVLSNFYGYDVKFAEWANFGATVDAQDLSTLGTLPPRYPNWGRVLHAFLSATEVADIGEAGEVQELTIMIAAISIVLKTFDFRMKVKNGSDDDVTCSIMSTNKDFLFTEGKESASLPRRLCTGGHHLCTIGFAIKVARVKWKPPAPDPDIPLPDWHPAAGANNGLRKALQTYLRVGGGKPGDATATSVHPSQTTNNLLRNTHAQLNVSRNAVHGFLDADQIEKEDCVQLWAAVMQACHYSVKKGRRQTIVMSARMFWYLEFGDTCPCTVRISVARKVGSRNFLTTLVKFLKHASMDASMTAPCRRRWEKALAKPPRTSPRKPKRRAASSASGPRQKQLRFTTGGSDGSDASAKLADCKLTDLGSLSAGSEEDEETSCFGFDEFDMVIPWFDQIGDTLEVLGRGRSGEVTKVSWNSRYVALKTFILKFDDDRDLQSVYAHELDVLRSLRDLWGTHVPSLLFHKPWQTSPMIGLELGRPLDDDMSEWSDEDREKADETIEEIRKLGWCQNDLRGANFVRLRGASDQVERIAMIDFESMVKVSAT